MNRAGLMVVAALACSACGASHPYVWVDDLPRSATAEVPQIRAGDRLYVLVKGQDALTGEVPVRLDGNIVHPVFGVVAVAGTSPREAARRIEARLRNVVLDANVSVAIAARLPYQVSVVGEVTHPGPLELEPGEGVLQALARAGGFTEFANRSGIYVLRQRPEDERVRFRYDDLAGGDARSLGFRLHDGDVVVVE